jgi:hypothetical protein
LAALSVRHDALPKTSSADAHLGQEATGSENLIKIKLLVDFWHKVIAH